MAKKKILFICGSRNQTTMMHKISMHFDKTQYNLRFSPYYTDSVLNYLVKKGILDFTILGKKMTSRALEYFHKHGLEVDYGGKSKDYDLVYTCSDLIIPTNIKHSKIILVQEGMTDPENLMYYAAKYLGLPRWAASTSTTGLSDAYEYFCVASYGYKDLFIRKGVNPEKIIVTGLPNFDNVKEFTNNDFPYSNYVMVATSDARETLKYENRKKFIREALNVADGRQLLFKFHPNENYARASAEVEKYAPGSFYFIDGNTDHMIANCDTLVTKYSSVVYIGLALGKKVYSYFDLKDLLKMVPIQNGGASSKKIAELGHDLITGNIKNNYLKTPYSLQEAYN